MPPQTSVKLQNWKLQAETTLFYDSGSKFVIISSGPRPDSFPAKESWPLAGDVFFPSQYSLFII